MKLTELIVTLIKEFVLDGESLTIIVLRNKLKTLLFVTNVILMAAFIFMFEQAVNNAEEIVSLRQTLKDAETHVNKGQVIIGELTPGGATVEFKYVEEPSKAPVKKREPVKTRTENDELTDKLRAIRAREL